MRVMIEADPGIAGLQVAYDIKAHVEKLGCYADFIITQHSKPNHYEDELAAHEANFMRDADGALRQTGI